MEVRRVVSKLEWQTWNRIVVNKNVGGNVTLNVHDVPLDEVLNIIGLQTDSRWTHLYPIYSTGKSFASFNKVLLGNLPPAGNGWTALQQLAAWQQNGLGGFANTLRAENKLVSAQLVDKDLAFTALALSRFSKAQLVPEDGTLGMVNLRLQQVPFEKAVAKVARQVHRKWSQVYTLQPLNVPTLVRQAPLDSFDERATNNGYQASGREPASRHTAPGPALEALVSTMSPEERQQTLDQISSASQMAGLSPAERQQQIQSGSGPAAQAAQAAQEDMENRIENRLKNGTIDQRLAHDRRTLGAKPAESNHDPSNSTVASLQAGLHPDRIAGGHRHHRHSRFSAHARFQQGQRQSQRHKCISNLRQIGIALSIYADENQGRLPLCRTCSRPAPSLLRMFCLASSMCSPTMSAEQWRSFDVPGTGSAGIRKEGSSYEWNYQANGKPIVLPGVINGIQMTHEKARLMYDYDNFHPGSTNGTKNVLHGDGHVAPIR